MKAKKMKNIILFSPSSNEFYFLDKVIYLKIFFSFQTYLTLKHHHSYTVNHMIKMKNNNDKFGELTESVYTLR